MSTLDTGLTLIRSASRQVASANGWLGQAFKRWMPKGLYARALLIIIVPMVVLQSVIAFVFMERHWNTVTRRLSAAVVRDIASLIDVSRLTRRTRTARFCGIAQNRLGLVVDFLPVADLPPPGPKPFFSLLDQTLSVQLGQQIAGRSGSTPSAARRWSRSVFSSTMPSCACSPSAARAYASNSEIFLFWMVGTSWCC